MNQKQEKGIKGEIEATKYLKRHGYKIICKNFRCMKGEIDIIAYNKENILFVEVKTRTSTKYGEAREAIDRDKQNFKEFQYDELVRFCKENHVHLYVSNPNFEFWLMLHFPEVEVDDTSEMLENRYVSSSRRYLEKRLHDICKYKKSKLNFKCFEPYVQEAIVREKKYAEDLDSLKNELGSNVGILIDDMLHHS